MEYESLALIPPPELHDFGQAQILPMAILAICRTQLIMTNCVEEGRKGFGKRRGRGREDDNASKLQSSAAVPVNTSTMPLTACNHHPGENRGVQCIWEESTGFQGGIESSSLLIGYHNKGPVIIKRNNVLKIGQFRTINVKDRIWLCVSPSTITTDFKVRSGILCHPTSIQGL